MPKTYPKTYPKKTKPKKTKFKDQPKPVSLVKRKSYWITLTLFMLVFTIVFGYAMKISAEGEALILGTIFSIIAFAFYIGFKPSIKYDKRATFMFVGASIVGFCIWAAMVLSLGAAGILLQIVNLVGTSFFSITSLTICLIAGAFIGDLIGKNKEGLRLFASKFKK
jgi:hypothetical protein